MNKYYIKDIIIVTNNYYIILNLMILIANLHSYQDCL